jgi:outer membrane biosynthesis protein TonB
MKSYASLIILLVLGSQAFAQYSPELARPVVGWDSLRNLIVFPEIAKRAGLQGYVDVSVQLDSLDNVGEIKIVGFEIFYQCIKDAVRKIKWTHEASYGFKRSTLVLFTVEFNLRPSKIPDREVLRIEADRPIILKSY